MARDRAVGSLEAQRSNPGGGRGERFLAQSSRPTQSSASALRSPEEGLGLVVHAISGEELVGSLPAHDGLSRLAHARRRHERDASAELGPPSRGPRRLPTRAAGLRVIMISAWSRPRAVAALRAYSTSGTCFPSATTNELGVGSIRA